MNRILLFLPFFLAGLMGCKKSREPEPELFRTFGIDISWNDKPKVLKTWGDDILLGFTVSSSSANAAYRFISVSADGIIKQTITRQSTEIFNGYTTVYPNLSISFESGKLFLSTLCIREETTEDAYFLVVKELNASFEVIQTIEKKILIGGHTFDVSSKFFFVPFQEGYLVSVNIMEPGGKPGIYQEILDENFKTLKYWKKSDLTLQALLPHSDSYFGYGFSSSGLTQIFKFNDGGQVTWSHQVVISNANASYAGLSEVQLMYFESGLLLGFGSADNVQVPVLTYKVNFATSLSSEAVLPLLSYSYLNFISTGNSGFMYVGKSCVSASNCKPYWAKYDENTNLIFSKILPDKFNHNMSALYVNETENGFTVFGLKDDFSAKIPEGFFLKTNKNGDLGEE